LGSLLVCPHSECSFFPQAIFGKIPAGHQRCEAGHGRSSDIAPGASLRTLGSPVLEKTHSRPLQFVAGFGPAKMFSFDRRPRVRFIPFSTKNPADDQSGGRLDSHS
jgi:hypothetical protein